MTRTSKSSKYYATRKKRCTRACLQPRDRKTGRFKTKKSKRRGRR